MPMKVLNSTQRPFTLWCNAKITDVFPCVVVEELPIIQGLSKTQNAPPANPAVSLDSASDLIELLVDSGLPDTDINDSEVSEELEEETGRAFVELQRCFLQRQTRLR